MSYHDKLCPICENPCAYMDGIFYSPKFKCIYCEKEYFINSKWKNEFLCSNECLIEHKR